MRKWEILRQQNCDEVGDSHRWKQTSRDPWPLTPDPDFSSPLVWKFTWTTVDFLGLRSNPPSQNQHVIPLRLKHPRDSLIWFLDYLEYDLIWIEANPKTLLFVVVVIWVKRTPVQPSGDDLTLFLPFWTEMRKNMESVKNQLTSCSPGSIFLEVFVQLCPAYYFLTDLISVAPHLWLLVHWLVVEALVSWILTGQTSEPHC